VLLEHSGGSLPLWLSPVQVIIIPIADRHIEYATEVQKQFVNKDFRIEIDSRNERMNLKIRQAQMKKIPYMIIVGDREKEAGLVSIRGREEGNLDSLSPENFIKLLRNKL
jgi:threonyl-tRNA synthetase